MTPARGNQAALLPESLLLSVEGAAAQLRIGRSRMFDLIRTGAVISVKVGGSQGATGNVLSSLVTYGLTSGHPGDARRPV